MKTELDTGLWLDSTFNEKISMCNDNNFVSKMEKINWFDVNIMLFDAKLKIPRMNFYNL